MKPRPQSSYVLLASLLAMLALAGGCSWFGMGSPDQTTAQAHYGQAMSLKASGDINQAALELQEAIKADPNMYHAYYQLGILYQAQGRRDWATYMWRQGLARAQTGPERTDYPRMRAMAEMRAALAGLAGKEPMAPPATDEPEPVQGMGRPVMREPLERPVASQPQASQAAPKAQARAMAPKGQGDYTVLFSSNLARANADKDVAMLRGRGYEAQVSTFKAKGRTWHRVTVGQSLSKAEADKLAAKLRRSTGRKPLAIKQ